MSRFIAVLLLALLGCKSDTVTAPTGKLTGVFVLRTINGAALPAPGNGPNLTDFTMIADTIRVFEDGFGEEIFVKGLPGPGAIIKEDQLLQVWDKGSGHFDVEYPCPDQLSTASCIAPPHHSGVQTAKGMTLTYSVFYKVPLAYERVGDYIRPSLSRAR